MVTQTAAQTGGNSSPREETFRNQLLEQYYKFLGPHTAEEIWDTLLTEEERTRLGILKNVFETRGRGVGIFARAKNVSLEVATIEVSRFYGLSDIKYHYLCHELFHFTGERIGPLATETTPQVISTSRDKPVWDSDRNQLWFQGQVVRQYRGRTVATRIHRILDAFREEGWPCRIDGPLPNGPDSGRLRSAISKLNERLSGIRFFADGSGEGILWEPFNLPNNTEDQAPESV